MKSVRELPFHLKPFTKNENGALKVDGSVSIDGHKVSCVYNVVGDPKKFVIPEIIPNPQFTNDLWKNTCFELFVSQEGTERYIEWNFSLNGNWAQYAFCKYRTPIEISPAPPRIDSNHSENQITLIAEVDIPRTFFPDSANFLVGISTVLENIEGELGYYAIHHNHNHPDFHNRAHFVEV